MTQTLTEHTSAAPAVEAPAANQDSDNAPRERQPRRGGPRRNGPARSGAPAAPAKPPRPVHPVIEQLVGLYPALFGDRLLPLKRGVFQDLMAAHPELFQKDSLREALGQHTRSTRYLAAVADGLQRHDLQGQPVEAMASEHVYQALLETFRRRHARTGQDVRTKLRNRMLVAFEASGLSREAYCELVHCRDEAANALLAEALVDVDARMAKDAALLRAFEATPQDVTAFADTYGMHPEDAGRMLDRARHRRAVAAAASAAAAAAQAAAEAATAADATTEPATDTPPGL